MKQIRKYDNLTGKSSAGLLKPWELGFRYNFSLSSILSTRRWSTSRSGWAWFQKVDSYTPGIASLAAYALEFDHEEKASEDIRIKRNHTGNSFRAGKDGNYQINTRWTVTITDNMGAFDISLIELFLYKNGSLYEKLDAEEMRIFLPSNNNAYKQVAELQGSKVINLTVSDTFDIRLRHDGDIPMDALVEHGGYMEAIWQEH